MQRIATPRMLFWLGLSWKWAGYGYKVAAKVVAASCTLQVAVADVLVLALAVAAANDALQLRPCIKLTANSARRGVRYKY